MFLWKLLHLLSICSFFGISLSEPQNLLILRQYILVTDMSEFFKQMNMFIIWSEMSSLQFFHLTFHFGFFFCFRFISQFGENGDRTLQECVCANKEGMVYLLDDWGMGDTETRNRKYAEQSRQHLLDRRDQQDGCDEVDLHPLSNQVRDLFIVV